MTPVIFQPTVFQRQIVASAALSNPLEGLSTTGLVFAYDFQYPQCWAGSGRVVYDLSSNGFNGSMTGSIDSSSAGYLSFPGSTAVLEVGNGDSNFYGKWNNNKNLLIGVQYLQTSSWGKNTSFASTWDTIGSYNAGYQFFLDVLANGTCDTGVQLYTPAQGFYTTGGTVTTSSNPNRIIFKAISNNVAVYMNNSQIQSYSTSATKAFYYGTANGDYGKVIRIGHRVGLENFAGKIKRVICYNTDADASTIDTWLNRTAT